MGRGKNKPGRSNKNKGERGNKPGQRPHLSGAEQEKAKRKRRRLNFAQQGHVFGAPTPTSLMTQAASFASIDEWVHMPLAEREARKESKRIRDQFLNSELEPIDERQRPPEDIQYNKPVLFTVGGGAKLQLPPHELSRCTVHHVERFRIPHQESPYKGLLCKSLAHDVPTFILVPHYTAAEEVGVDDVQNSSAIVSALEAVLKVQKASTVRSCEVVCTGRYAGCIGAVVTRGEAGVRDFSYHRDKLGSEVYDLVIGYATSLEEVFVRYVPLEILWRIEAAQKVSNYKTMQSSDGDATTGAKIFSSMAVAKNATLASHTDKDFVTSLITILLKNYNPEKDRDRVLAYFVFPDANISVPLKHGSVLIFNPLCRHSISCRSSETDDLLVLSLYTKTSHVGGNDNGQIISDEVRDLSSKCRDYLNKS